MSIAVTETCISSLLDPQVYNKMALKILRGMTVYTHRKAGSLGIYIEPFLLRVKHEPSTKLRWVKWLCMLNKIRYLMPMNIPCKSVEKASYKQSQHKCKLDAQPHRGLCVSEGGWEERNVWISGWWKELQSVQQAIGEKLQLNIDQTLTCSTEPELAAECNSDK